MNNRPSWFREPTLRELAIIVAVLSVLALVGAVVLYYLDDIATLFSAGIINVQRNIDLIKEIGLPSIGTAQNKWFMKEIALWFNQGSSIFTMPGPMIQNLIFLATGLAFGMFIAGPRLKKRVKVFTFLWPALIWIAIFSLAQNQKVVTDSAVFFVTFACGIVSFLACVYFFFKK